MKDIKALLEQHTNEEGTVDYNAVEAAVNEEINNIVAKNKPNTDKLKDELKGEVAKEIISGLGIDGETIDDLKLWSKKMAGNTDEIKEENVQLSNKLKELEAQYNETAEAKASLEKSLLDQERLGKLRQVGIKDEETAEFVKFKLEKMVNDEVDFDTALNEFKEQSPSYFRQKDVTTFRRFTENDNSTAEDKDADVLRAFEARKSK